MMNFKFMLLYQIANKVNVNGDTSQCIV